jgi:hypothetical protein
LLGFCITAQGIYLDKRKWKIKILDREREREKEEIWKQNKGLFV